MVSKSVLREQNCSRVLFTLLFVSSIVAFLFWYDAVVIVAQKLWTYHQLCIQIVSVIVTEERG